MTLRSKKNPHLLMKGTTTYRRENQNKRINQKRWSAALNRLLVVVVFFLLLFYSFFWVFDIWIMLYLDGEMRNLGVIAAHGELEDIRIVEHSVSDIFSDGYKC